MQSIQIPLFKLFNKLHVTGVVILHTVLIIQRERAKSRKGQKRREIDIGKLSTKEISDSDDGPPVQFPQKETELCLEHVQFFSPLSLY